MPTGNAAGDWDHFGDDMLLDPPAAPPSQEAQAAAREIAEEAEYPVLSNPWLSEYDDSYRVWLRSQRPTAAAADIAVTEYDDSFRPRDGVPEPVERPVPPTLCEELDVPPEGPTASVDTRSASAAGRPGHRWWVHELQDLRNRAKQYRQRNEGSDGIVARLQLLGEQQRRLLEQARLRQRASASASEQTMGEAPAEDLPYVGDRHAAFGDPAASHPAGVPSGIPAGDFDHFGDDMLLDRVPAEGGDGRPSAVAEDDVWGSEDAAQPSPVNQGDPERWLPSERQPEPELQPEAWPEPVEPPLTEQSAEAEPDQADQLRVDPSAAPYPPRIAPSPFARPAQDVEFQPLVPERRVLGQGEEVSQPRIIGGGVHVPKLRLRLPRADAMAGLDAETPPVGGSNGVDGWQMDALFERRDDRSPASSRDIRAVAQGVYPVAQDTPVDRWYPLRQESDAGATANLAQSTLMRAQQRRNELLARARGAS